MARRTMVLRRWGEASRRCSGLFILHGAIATSVAQRARASQARVLLSQLRLRPIDSERSGALACSPREGRLCVEGRSWHGAPRSCADGERRLAGVVAVCGLRVDYC